MDSPADVAWGPDRRISVAMLVAALGALAWRLIDRNTENQLVAVVLLVVCAVVAVALIRIRVRLRATDLGIAVTGPLHTRQVAWSQIRSISAPRRGRFGRRAAMLELEITTSTDSDSDSGSDSDDELLAFGRFDLGADPAEVARELLRRRAANR